MSMRVFFESVVERGLWLFDRLMAAWWNWRAKRNGWIVIANERDYDRVPSRAAPSLPVGTGQLLPDATESEEIVLGTLLADPQLIPKTLARLDGVSVFYAESCKILWDTIKTMHEEGMHLDSVTISTAFQKRVRELTHDPHATAHLLAWVGGLPDKSLGEAFLDFHLNDVVSSYVKRATLSLLDEARGRLFQEPAGIVLDGLAESARFLQRQLPGATAIEDATALLADPPAMPDEIICGVLNRQCLMGVGGSSKTNKSWAMIDLALSIATGTPWLDFPVLRMPILYANFELLPAVVAKRIGAVLAAKNLSLEPGMLDVFNARGASDSPELILRNIESAGTTKEYGAIFLDPLYRLYTQQTEEVNAAHIASLLTRLETLAGKTKAAVVYVSHFSKGVQAQKDAIDRFSGSGSFGRVPDALMTLTAHEQPDCYTVEFVLRNHPPVEPFTVRWTYPIMIRDQTLDPSRLKQRAGRRQQFDSNNILKLLPPEGLKSRFWQAKAVKIGISERTFFRLRNELEADGKVTIENGIWIPKQ